MITYQDYEKAQDKTKWLQAAINKYRGSAEYKKAVEECEYMAGRNCTIMNAMRVIYDMAGIPMTNFAASNNKIRNRMIHRLVTDRCSYSLGNGVTFAGKKKENINGKEVTVDPTKDTLGDRFDREVYRTAYWALSNGEAFLYVHKGYEADKWEYNLFKKTEFLPLYDEHTGVLRGGIRFWSLEWGKRPVIAILYTEEGYTRYETPEGKNSISSLEQVKKLKPYTVTVTESEAYGQEVVATNNPGRLPIFPLYSGENRASALDNQKPLIDAFDMILSGFANDINDIAQVYWLVSGAMGWSEADKRQLLDRLILQHMAVVDGENSKIEGFTQDIPYEAREKCMTMLRNQMYENWGGFDVHTIEAGSTNDHIDAGYWPMDEEADAFEYELIEFIQNILRMIGIEDVPQFKRNKVSNQKEQTEMVMMAADVLDEQTILEKLPWITVDEVDVILARRDAENYSRFEEEESTPDDQSTPEEDAEE